MSTPQLICINPAKELTPGQYAERFNKSPQQVSNMIKAGQLHVREIPELGIRLIQLEASLFEANTIEIGADLYSYGNKDLGFFFSKVLNDYARLGQEFDEKDKALQDSQCTVAALRDEITSLNEIVSQKVIEMYSLHFNLNEMSSHNEVMKKVNSDLNAKIGEKEAKNSHLSHLLTTAQNEIKGLRTELEVKQNEVISLKEQIDVLTSKLSSQSPEVDSDLVAKVVEQVLARIKIYNPSSEVTSDNEANSHKKKRGRPAGRGLAQLLEDPPGT